MNHSTSIVIPTCFQFIQMPERKFVIFYILIRGAKNRRHNDTFLEEIGLRIQFLLICVHSIGNDMRH
jgi:hypothetical protein